MHAGIRKLSASLLGGFPVKLAKPGQQHPDMVSRDMHMTDLFMEIMHAHSC